MTKATHKIRTKLRFTRPKIQKLKSKPVLIKSIKNEIKKKTNENINYHDILIQPIASDKNLENMEQRNTITFVVHPMAKKPQIKEAFFKLYKMKVRKVNTLHQIGKFKKAYIRLQNDGDALNLASKKGILWLIYLKIYLF